MRKKSRILSLLTLPVLCLATLTSCSTTETDAPSAEATDAMPRPLRFSVTTAGTDGLTVTDEYVTRGLPFSSEVDEPFGITAYVYDTWDAATVTPYDKLFNKEVQFLGSGQWSTAEAVSAITGSGNVSIYAYCPYYDSDDETPNGVVEVTSTSTTPGPPQLTITVPADVTKQADVLYATGADPYNEMNETPDIPLASINQAIQDDQAIPMKFKHLLTQIRFERGTISKGIIKSITIEGIKDKATYTVGEANVTLNEESTQTYKIEPDYDTSSASSDINGDNLRLMLLPQTLTDAAKVTLVFDDGREFTKTIDLGTDTWQPGKVVTYMVSITSYKKLEVKCVSIKDWTDGGEVEAGVTGSSLLRPEGKVTEWDNQEDYGSDYLELTKE